MSFWIWFLMILLCLICLVIGFLVGKFWRSRKIDTTIEKAKMMARNPAAIPNLSKEIAEIWKGK